MPELAGTKTEQNLKEAFAGESQANRKYLAFAKKADQDGHPQVAKLFRAAAAAETVHAHAHLRALKAIGSTEENLREAVSGETHEFMNMYPDMIVAAEQEGFTEALRSFKFANTVEKVHADLYQKALDNLGNNAPVDYYVCQVCGHTLEGEPTGPCEVCNAGKNAFVKID
ncbi:rubrerythrin family protein [Geoalkalibacter halelectricus]|uniref:Rubrerythrin family protein n=1 Tax=Geoalkalibacter halelectricus TaxID=2847045 RepID=A0ABY5ZM45_9BACT|nr:rubrerythrin family protein [Geoalkalibacter halelectricus]MDO3378443.1 rubrerythrin family protein [Geoalkalibacter halelectricus]UWZ80237.1 rubrerythrin family protein [Geoalkalibacter halelectricus]